MRKRKYTDNELIESVKSSQSVREVLRKLSKSPQGGGSYSQIYQDCDRLNLDISHFLGQGYLKGKTHDWGLKIPFDKLLIKNSVCTNRTSLKRRLIKDGLLKNECSICKQLPKWNELTLVMVLDHINGINNDNRLENLRLICPNCNSQQSTFAGRNNKH